MKWVVLRDVMFAFSKEGDVFAPQGNGYATLGNVCVSLGNALCHQKKGYDDFGMEIPKHFEYKCNKICLNFQVVERRLLQMLFVNLNISNHQTLLF
jgi:hypothetical protein